MFHLLHRRHLVVGLVIFLLAGLMLACRLQGSVPSRSSSLIQIPVTVQVYQTVAGPKMILERLRVDFLGADGHKVIGSGCPGSAGKGIIEDYHLVVHGVNPDKKVLRVLVAGDNSTLTWELPCNGNWELLARDVGAGKWDVFIAPSLPTRVYVVLFFYEDNTMAMGVARAE
jgi:hypothetical protein